MPVIVRYFESADCNRLHQLSAESQPVLDRWQMLEFFVKCNPLLHQEGRNFEIAVETLHYVHSSLHSLGGCSSRKEQRTARMKGRIVRQCAKESFGQLLDRGVRLVRWALRDTRKFRCYGAKGTGRLWRRLLIQSAMALRCAVISGIATGSSTSQLRFRSYPLAVEAYASPRDAVGIGHRKDFPMNLLS